MQAQLAAAYDPPACTFTWKPGYPASLHELWQQGSANTVETGAITAFEGDHELETTEAMSPALWTALLKAAAGGDVNTDGYSYAIANQHLPEMLTIWHNGQKRLTTPANTGISVSQTEVGTFPVYEKLPFQIMSGTNPDGSHYATRCVGVVLQRRGRGALLPARQLRVEPVPRLRGAADVLRPRRL